VTAFPDIDRSRRGSYHIVNQIAARGAGSVRLRVKPAMLQTLGT
jgi:hypothetical protein